MDVLRNRRDRLPGQLLRAAHPLPTAAVTTLTTVLALTAAVAPARAALLAGAVLAGQLSVGWLNDLVDRDRDRAVGRRDKPLATGALSLPAVRAAIWVATLTCVLLSLALGPLPALTHLGAVAGAWAYNLGLKRTAWSWAPYGCGFGLLPVTVWLVAPAGGLPPWWLIAATALLGVGAHGANVLPDLVGDRATGVRGLPHRLTPRTLRAATAALLLAALALLVLAAPGRRHAWEWAALAAGSALAVTAAAARSRHARAPFVAVLAIAAIAVTVLIARGTAG